MNNIAERTYSKKAGKADIALDSCGSMLRHHHAALLYKGFAILRSLS